MVGSSRIDIDPNAFPLEWLIDLSSEIQRKFVFIATYHEHRHQSLV